jgi:hypothetical protein
MAANTQPVFSRLGDIQWGVAALLTANTAKDGTGTVTTVFTADATNGGFVSRLIARPIGTNVSTVLRIFVNNGATNTVAGNNTLIAELSLPATTISEVVAQSEYVISLNFPLPAGYKINCTVGTTVAAGYQLTVLGGKY